MPQPKKAGRFGGTAAHHNRIMSNLATELIRHGRIRTTYAKAKTVQPLAERMITFGRRGDLHSRRQVLRVIRDKDVVHKLFTDVGPAYAQRDGGYTRIFRLEPRRGDAAPMALIELVESTETARDVALDEAPARRWSLRRRRGTQSRTARERAQERAAAIDRGELLEGADFEDEGEEISEPVGAGAEDEEGPQVDPAEVEARLAAEEEDEAEEPEAEVEAEEPEAEDEAEEPEAETSDEEPSDDEDDEKS